MKYLDDNGFTYLWSKIKNKFAEKNTQMITLTSSGWTLSDGVYSQTVNVSGVTANSIVIISPTPGSYALYGDSGVYCISQASGKLTFNASASPGSDLIINVVNLGNE